MDKQKTFDLVVAHARKQGCKSTDPNNTTASGKPTCMYRGPNGTKCFVGVLIPDDKYSEGLESWGAYSGAVSRILGDLGHSMTLCGDLQDIHDNNPVDKWERRFSYVAARNNLTYTPAE